MNPRHPDEFYGRPTMDSNATGDFDRFALIQQRIDPAPVEQWISSIADANAAIELLW
jgi:hypothetical protein